MLEHADKYMRAVATATNSAATNDTAQNGVQLLYKWCHHERRGDQLEREIRFSTGDWSPPPRAYLIRDDRRKAREAALEYDIVPAYGDVTPAERHYWTAYPEQSFGKPNQRSARPPDAKSMDPRS